MHQAQFEALTLRFWNFVKTNYQFGSHEQVVYESLFGSLCHECHDSVDWQGPLPVMITNGLERMDAYLFFLEWPEFLEMLTKSPWRFLLPPDVRNEVAILIRSYGDGDAATAWAKVFTPADVVFCMALLCLSRLHLVPLLHVSFSLGAAVLWRSIVGVR